MIRVLVLIAAVGFLLSVVTISAAIAIAGPEAMARGAWTWNFGPGGRWEHRRGWADEAGPQTVREIPWTGGGRLIVDIPAEIAYTQSEGPAKLTLSGSKGAVEAVVLEDGRLRFAPGRHRWGRVRVVMTAPNVERFDVRGDSDLRIEGYRRKALTLDLSGDSEVAARGETTSVALDISGSAKADLGQLKTEAAEIGISGSGEAMIAPTESARIEISGSGDVTLLTRPRRLDTEVSGSGRIHQAQEGEPAPSPSATPPAKPPART
jgi:hypothetical protein